MKYCWSEIPVKNISSCILGGFLLKSGCLHTDWLCWKNTTPPHSPPPHPPHLVILAFHHHHQHPPVLAGDIMCQLDLHHICFRDFTRWVLFSIVLNGLSAEIYLGPVFGSTDSLSAAVQFFFCAWVNVLCIIYTTDCVTVPSEIGAYLVYYLM